MSIQNEVNRSGAVPAGGIGAKLGGYATWVFAQVGALPPILVIMIVIFGVGNPIFLSPGNLTTLSVQSIFLLLVSLGQLIVLITGGFDLSVGANVALTSVVSSLVMVSFPEGGQFAEAYSIWMGVLAGVGVGLIVGLVNGVGVAILKVNAFIVTLASMSIFAGLTLVVSSGSEVSGLPRVFTHAVGSGYLFGIPILVLITLPIVLIVAVFLWRTRFGRQLYAIGGNVNAALVSGIRVRSLLILAYVISGVLSSCAGLLLTARIASGQPLLGASFPLESIAAAIIGGASLSGGRGNVVGTVLGVFFIMGLTNGMDLLRMDTNQQLIAVGIVLILAVVAERLRDGARVRVAMRRKS